MSGMDFPDAPSMDQIFTSGGHSWQWNGYAWIGIGVSFPDAPINNIAYGRYNATWTPVLMLSNDILDGGNF
jgi:hypothetical protein